MLMTHKHYLLSVEFFIFTQRRDRDTAKKSLYENRDFRGIFVTRILELLTDENNFAYENFAPVLAD